MSEALRNVELEVQKEVAEAVVDELGLEGNARVGLSRIIFDLITERNRVNEKLGHLRDFISVLEKNDK